MQTIPSNIVAIFINLIIYFLSFLPLAFGGIAQEPSLEGSVNLTKPAITFGMITISG